MKKPTLDTFYIIAPLELVEDLRHEIEEVWPFLLDEVGRPNLDPLILLQLQGGVEIQCRSIFGLQLNRILKLASRILWRKGFFKARELYQMESQIKSLEWSKWCKDGDNIKFSIAASESKVNNEKKIDEILNKILGKKYRIVKEGETQHFYIRHHQNEFQISKDTSGEHLHKRGLTLYKTKAPIRETLAAAGLKWMLADTSINEHSSLTWLDPMAGSGTHGAELISINSLSPREDYSYVEFSDAPKILKSNLFWQTHPLNQASSFKAIILADKDPHAIDVLRKNFAQIEFLKKSICEIDLFSIESRDFFKISEADKLFVIVNPPYGERLELKEPQVEFHKIISHLILKIKADRVGIWTPASVKEIKTEAKLVTKKSLKNGGMPVYFRIYKP